MGECCQQGHAQVAKVMVGATRGGVRDNIDDLGRTPLHFAVSSGSVELVKLLLVLKADPGAQDVDGISPRDALGTSSPEIAALLHSTGTDETPWRADERNARKAKKKQEAHEAVEFLERRYLLHLHH